MSESEILMTRRNIAVGTVKYSGREGVGIQ